MRMSESFSIVAILMVIGYGILGFIAIKDEENHKNEQTVIEDSSTWNSIE